MIIIRDHKSGENMIVAAEIRSLENLGGLEISTFVSWQHRYAKDPRYRTVQSRLQKLEEYLQAIKMQTQDPIQYIVHLYKSDTIIESAPSIAKFLNTLIDSNGTQVAIWTPKMIRSLFGQISLAANDKREFLKNSSGGFQVQHVQIKVAEILDALPEVVFPKIVFIYDGMENDEIEKVLKLAGHESIDDFFYKMVEKGLGSRPISQILGAICSRFAVNISGEPIKCVKDFRVKWVSDKIKAIKVGIDGYDSPR